VPVTLSGSPVGGTAGKFPAAPSNLCTGQFYIQGRFRWLTDNSHLSTGKPHPPDRSNQNKKGNP
jgi:hypothetical protein